MKILLAVFLLAGSLSAIGQDLPKAGPPSVALAWKASITGGVTSYRVLRSSSSGGPYVRIKSGIVGTSCVDKSVLAGETYFYVVRADCPSCAPPVSKSSNQAEAIVP
jgi:hypothetical protein